jgi:hypothetical protein
VRPAPPPGTTYSVPSARPCWARRTARRRNGRRKVRTGRQLALERSQRLGHITGAAWFFVALARHAREHGGGELQSWLSEQEVTQRLYLTTWDASHDPHPDGLGIWAEGNKPNAGTTSLRL